MKDNFKSCYELTRKIVNQLENNQYVGEYNPTKFERNQAEVSTLPLISNYVHQNRLELLEEERMSTLIKLARVLNDEEIGKVIQGLGYQLILKK